jgi:phosphatidylserine/phosphatidylglycerophosphate/cardiolipin synthase-like enzyme
MKTMRICSWMRAALIAALGAAMASGGGGTFCHAQASSETPVPAGTYYAPVASLEPLDVKVLASAEKTVDLAAFSLTDAAIAKALAADAGRGVKIRIYLDRCARIPLHNLLDLPGVTVKVKFSKVLMHLKSYEIDGMLVRDGSANFSEQGESRQDNSATFTSDPRALAVFKFKFEEMWARPDNLTVTVAVKAK